MKLRRHLLVIFLDFEGQFFQKKYSQKLRMAFKKLKVLSEFLLLNMIKISMLIIKS